MAKAKTKFTPQKPKPDRVKSLQERGVLLDPMNVNVKLKKLEVTKDELYGELARLWRDADYLKGRLSPKRQIRILEKVVTAPAFDDSLIPLRPNDIEEQMYFEALCHVKDAVLYIQDLLYDEMMEAEQSRRDAKQTEDT